VFAQASATVPPGYDSTESSGTSAYAYLLGYFPNMRCQVSSSDLTGKGVKTMAEISFRQDAAVTSSSSVARTWSNITMLLCETNASPLSTTWTGGGAAPPGGLQWHICLPVWIAHGAQPDDELHTDDELRPAVPLQVVSSERSW